MNVVNKGLCNLLLILICYQTGRDLSKSLARKDGLGTFALVSTPDATKVKARTATSTL